MCDTRRSPPSRQAPRRRSPGELAVCAGSCGPGNLHLINGLFDCHRTRTPVLAIAAHIPSAEIGSNYFQATHPEELFRECSDYCELVSSVEQLPYILETAIRTAVGRRGVAVIVIPGDVALRAAPKRTIAPNAGLLPKPPIVRPTDADLDALAALLAGSKKVTLCSAGAAAQGAHAPACSNWRRPLKSPIVHALGGKEFVEYENPYDVGMTGLIGFSSGFAAMQACDTLLMLGTDFPLSPVLSRRRQNRSGRHPAGKLSDGAASSTSALSATSARRSQPFCRS